MSVLFISRCLLKASFTYLCDSMITDSTVLECFITYLSLFGSRVFMASWLAMMKCSYIIDGSVFSLILFISLYLLVTVSRIAGRYICFSARTNI